MKDWYTFFACLLLSVSIWLVTVLSRNVSDVESVPVLACSNIEGYAAEASAEVSVTARCKASGFRLMRISMIKNPVRVEFEVADLRRVAPGQYSIEPAQLYRYVNEIFGPGVTVESFVSDAVTFRFAAVNHKKVPVIPVKYLTYKPQYTSSGPMRLEPDSVVVYGDPSKIDSITGIETSPLYLSDLKRNAHGIVSLEVPKGVRVSTNEVQYTVHVSRFVELEANLPVEMRNLPAGVRMAVFPPEVKVRLRCEFPLSGDPTRNLKAWVDYREFSRSMTGKCVVYVSGISDGVFSSVVSPEVCECVEKER